MRPQGSPAELERRRRRAVQLLEGGQSLVAVAWMVGAAVSAVWQWREIFRRAGANGLAAKPAPGRPPKLSPQQRQRLPQLLAVGAQHYGYLNDLWTTRRMAAVIQQELQVDYHPAQVSHILHDLGSSYQKPERRAVERNQAVIDHWQRSRWVKIKKSAPAESVSGFAGRKRVPAGPDRTPDLGAPRSDAAALPPLQPR